MSAKERELCLRVYLVSVFAWIPQGLGIFRTREDDANLYTWQHIHYVKDLIEI